MKTFKEFRSEVLTGAPIVPTKPTFGVKKPVQPKQPDSHPPTENLALKASKHKREQAIREREAAKREREVTQRHNEQLAKRI